MSLGLIGHKIPNWASLKELHLSLTYHLGEYKNTRRKTEKYLTHRLDTWPYG